MIKVRTDAAEAGLLDRHRERGSTFVYLPGDPPARAVSVTMPLRLESWSVPFGLLPVFEMNLPEGALRERLRLAFAKATGPSTNSTCCQLSVARRSDASAIPGDKEHLHEDVPFQSVDEILERRRGGDLFRYLLEKFASFSGISGVQPKILVRDEKAFAEMEHAGHRLSQSYKGATHIVKMWEANIRNWQPTSIFASLWRANTDSTCLPIAWPRTAWRWSLTVSICAWTGPIGDLRISAC
jgi:serine/threonine-protein kinase HipA